MELVPHRLHIEIEYYNNKNDLSRDILRFILIWGRRFAEADSNIREELDLYIQLCSLETNCGTLAVLAATLANGGCAGVCGVKLLAWTFIVIAVLEPSVMNADVRMGSWGEIVPNSDSLMLLIRVVRLGRRMTGCVVVSV
ncbi:hypothetical protein RB195_019002 [Necator americanus]|uniref:glutaminase n=1 Tax=Necator americanus TaxID=51031 RepID=A0ABR1CDS4_NECAM